MSRAEELAKEIREENVFLFPEPVAELCKLAGMEEEWDGTSLHDVKHIAYKAAQKLGVNIFDMEKAEKLAYEIRIRAYDDFDALDYMQDLCHLAGFGYEFDETKNVNVKLYRIVDKAANRLGVEIYNRKKGEPVITRADYLASKIRELSFWDPDLLEQLCKEAGMSDEWDAAGGEFEAVAFAAAEKLGVEIL